MEFLIRVLNSWKWEGCLYCWYAHWPAWRSSAQQPGTWSGSICFLILKNLLKWSNVLEARDHFVSHLSDKHCLCTHIMVVQVERNLCEDVVFESAPSNSGVTPTKQQKQQRRLYDRKKQYINPLGKIHSLSYSFPNLYRYTRVNPLSNHHVPLTIMIVCFFWFGKLEPPYQLIALCRGWDKMAGWEAGQYTNQVKASRMVEGGEDAVWSCSCL
jgi:hypothetical protein